MDEIIKLTKSLTEMAATEIGRLQKQVESMKCCANCGPDLGCDKVTFGNEHKVCKDWQSDNIKKEDREI